MRLEVGAREYPRTLILGGAILVLLRGLTVILIKVMHPDNEIVLVDVIYLIMGVILLGLGLLLATDIVPLAYRPWVFALAAVLVGLGLYINVALATTPLSFAVILLLLTTCGAATLAWAPFVTEVVLLLGAGLFVLVRWPIGPTMEWFMLTVGATALGAILLQVRLRTVSELADATAHARRLAVTDQLTGMLNRHGLMERVPGLWAEAIRNEGRIFVVFVDIRGLKQVNDRFGHEFGDVAIQAAARAVVKSVRAGDLVARWGGDELIVMGMGMLSDAEAFNARLQDRVEWTGADKDRWPGELSVGFAEGLASSESVDAIISRADHDMYRRRMPH